MSINGMPHNLHSYIVEYIVEMVDLYNLGVHGALIVTPINHASINEITCTVIRRKY